MEKFSELFKALGDVHRLNILRLIGEQEMCGCEIFKAKTAWHFRWDYDGSNYFRRVFV